jgi:hypothetical protein
VTALLDKAGELSEAGILIYPVGLGNASNFNNVFLIDLGNRGQGEFIYAETPSEPSIVDPSLDRQLFPLNKKIKAVIIRLDSTEYKIDLSTKVLEKYRGEMLENMSEVMSEAEERLPNAKQQIS